MVTNIGADAAKLAGLQIDFLQKLRRNEISFEHFLWFVNLRKSDRDKLIGVENILVDAHFILREEFKFTVPEDYNHGTQLAEFMQKNGEEFNLYHKPGLTDKNFNNPTHRLCPKKNYLVKLFSVLKEGLTFEDNLRFLKSHKALLVGAQGLSLLYQLRKDKFSAGTSVVSFDEKSRLWKDDGLNRRIPLIERRFDGSLDFIFRSSEETLRENDCLLCFCNY